MSASHLPNTEIGLFPDERPEDTAPRHAGILPSQAIKELIARGQLVGDRAISDEQIQPASLDLRLGDIAHRVRASFLRVLRAPSKARSKSSAWRAST